MLKNEESFASDAASAFSLLLKPKSFKFFFPDSDQKLDLTK
jgi:hypothetical protein